MLRKIKAKYIVDNLESLKYGEHVLKGGNEYWLSLEYKDDCSYDLNNGTFYMLSKDARLSGAINGGVYGKLINGVAYREV